MSLVSVVIPWGPNHPLPDELISVLKMSHEIGEIFLVADGHSGQAVEGVTLLSTGPVPKGPAYARNRGAEEAEGLYLLFIDADVVLPPDWVGAALMALAEEDATKVCGVVGLYGPSPQQGFLASYKNAWLSYSYSRFRLTTGGLLSSALLIRKESFDQVYGFDESFTTPGVEDTALGQTLLAQRKVARVLPLPGLIHKKTLTLPAFLGLTFRRASGLAALGTPLQKSSVPTWVPFAMGFSLLFWLGLFLAVLLPDPYGTALLLALPPLCLFALAVLVKDFLVVFFQFFPKAHFGLAIPLMMLEMPVAFLGGVIGLLKRGRSPHA